MTRWWTELVDEWRGRRGLRLGVMAVVGVVWLYGLLVWRDALQARDVELKREAGQLARLRAQSRVQDWPQRLATARAQLDTVDARVKAVETLGLAQADLQDWLAAQAARAGLANATIVVSAAAASEAGRGGAPAATAAATRPETALDLAYLVRAQVRGDFAPLAAYDLLAAIDGVERRVWVETLSIRPGPTARIEMSVIAAYRLKPRSAS